MGGELGHGRGEVWHWTAQLHLHHKRDCTCVCVFLSWPVAHEGGRALRGRLGWHGVGVIVRSLKSSRRKNDGHVRESVVLAWLGELLVSDEDKDGGRVEDRFGDRTEGWSDWSIEFTLHELFPV